MRHFAPRWGILPTPAGLRVETRVGPHPAVTQWLLATALAYSS